MLKKLLPVIVFLIVLAVGGWVVLVWLPGYLQEPSVTQLPPGVKAPGKGASADLPVGVRAFKAARIEFTDILPTMGTLQGQREVELKVETNGMIKALNFREGDLVSQGDVLVVLNDEEARLRIDYAKSKVDTAKSQLKLTQQRMSINQELFSIGAIIEAKLREAELEVEQAQSQVITAQQEEALAENELNKLVLHAPMEGVIGTRETEVGEYVTPQKILAVLIDIAQVDVELGIIERDIERIRMGQRVKIHVDSLPGVTFEGRIDNLAPLIEGKSRTLTAKVRVPNNKGQLLPGMFARSEIAVFEKADALVVPTSALQDTDQDGKFDAVYTVEGDRAKSKAITLGYLTTDYAEIVDGILEGDQVITEARGDLEDGSFISLIETEEAGIERVEPTISVDAN